MYNSVEQQFQLQTAISQKRNDESYIRWCQKISLEGFHLLFHESGLAPLSHPLSATISQKRYTLLGGFQRALEGTLWSEYAPGTLFAGEKKKFTVPAKMNPEL